MIVEGLQIGVNGVPLPGTLQGQDEPEHTISGPPRSNREGEQCFDPFYVSSRFADVGRLEFEVVQVGLVAKRGIGDSILEEGLDLSGAEEGAEVPCQGHDVSPESVGLEKVEDFIDVDTPFGQRRERSLKVSQPLSGDLGCVDVFWGGDTEAVDGRESNGWHRGHPSLSMRGGGV